MLGLETALAIVVQAMGPQWDRIAGWMSAAPARIAGLSGQGEALRVGAPANIAIFDPGVRWTVDPTAQASRSRNTPYAGMELRGRIEATYLRGEPTVLHGKATR
jgi:dihydroorotase